MNRRKQSPAKAELNKLLLKLDNHDFITEDYFKWDEDMKRSLTEDIIEYFYPIVNMGQLQTEHLLLGLLNAIRFSEELEDYEQAEILHRCYRLLLEKLNWEDIY